MASMDLCKNPHGVFLNASDESEDDCDIETRATQNLSRKRRKGRNKLLLAQKMRLVAGAFDFNDLNINARRVRRPQGEWELSHLAKKLQCEFAARFGGSVKVIPLK